MGLLRTLLPNKVPLRNYLKRSSVVLIHRLNEHGVRELLFIQRAHRHGDPWSGDMAFPGGRMEAGDAHPRAAAERETREETGLDLARYGHFEGRLPDLVTRQHSRRRPMVVTPYVFEWIGPHASTLNHEVDSVVWIPLAELRDPANRSTLRWRTPLGALRLPCIRYGERCIWGLSFSMLQTFLRSDEGRR